MALECLSERTCAPPAPQLSKPVVGGRTRGPEFWNVQGEPAQRSRRATGSQDRGLEGSGFRSGNTLNEEEIGAQREATGRSHRASLGGARAPPRSPWLLQLRLLSQNQGEGMQETRAGAGWSGVPERAGGSAFLKACEEGGPWLGKAPGRGSCAHRFLGFVTGPGLCVRE